MAENNPRSPESADVRTPQQIEADYRRDNGRTFVTDDARTPVPAKEPRYCGYCEVLYSDWTAAGTHIDGCPNAAIGRPSVPAADQPPQEAVGRASFDEKTGLSITWTPPAAADQPVRETRWNTYCANCGSLRDYCESATYGPTPCCDACTHAAASTPSAPQNARWYLGAMNDALCIINTPPRPSTDDVWFDRPDGPTLVLSVAALTEAQAQKIVDAHNATLAAAEERLPAAASTPSAPPSRDAIELRALWDAVRDPKLVPLFNWRPETFDILNRLASSSPITPTVEGEDYTPTMLREQERALLAFLDAIECEPGRVTPDAIAVNLRTMRAILARRTKENNR